MNEDNFKKLLDEALEPIKETLQEHTEVLQTLQSSVVTIENTLNGHGDMYKVNNSNDKKLEKD